jgi:hypothetical protein
MISIMQLLAVMSVCGTIVCCVFIVKYFDYLNRRKDKDNCDHSP